MTPIIFGGCRGWYHPAPNAVVRNRGVVMCAPFGYEALCTHRGWRRLAEQLALAGLPVLRFDYPGTGDSAGEEASNRIADWLASIHGGADWLRREASVAEVALCGLRLGATLAATAAAQRPDCVDALILLAPINSGRMHLRELTLAAAASSGTTQMPDWFESAGFRLHTSDVTALRNLDLNEALARARPPQVFVADVVNRPALNAASLARLADLDVSIRQVTFTGYEAYLRHSHLSTAPTEVFGRVVDWALAGSAHGQKSSPYIADDCLECEGGMTERVVRFGQSENLVGVLCEPATARRGTLPVLILNTGANHRIGNSRLAVRMARQLAASGTTSLRVDAAGIGDSDRTAIPEIDWTTRLFDATTGEDVNAAVDALQQRGFSQCLVVGVCSGAHKAFQAALRDPRIVGLALANLPAFDRSAGGAPALDGGPPPNEIALLRRPRMALRRLYAEIDRYIAEMFGLELGLDRAGAWLRMLQARGTTVLLAYSSKDRALRELRAHFGRRGRHLPQRAPISSKVLSGTDHSLNSYVMQQEFITWIAEHLWLHHGPHAAGDCSSVVAPNSVPRRFANAIGWLGFGMQSSVRASTVEPQARRSESLHDNPFENLPK